jgi:hypothetical protein
MLSESGFLATVQFVLHFAELGQTPALYDSDAVVPKCAPNHRLCPQDDEPMINDPGKHEVNGNVSSVIMKLREPVWRGISTEFGLELS